MSYAMGVQQRTLRRTLCQWGDQSRTHFVLVPFFHSDYKVIGIVGWSPNEDPVWYPGVPVTVERRRLVFKGSLTKLPPPWAELPANAFDEAYYHDSWGALKAEIQMMPGAPSLERAANLAGSRLSGRIIVDVMFERPLHRVRAFVLKGRFFRNRTVSIMSMPALTEALQPPAKTEARTPALDAVPLPREGWITRLIRKALAPNLRVPPKSS